MTKITVSKELAETLDTFLVNRKFTPEELLYVHMKNDRNWASSNPLNGMSGLELANILSSGYETKKEPLDAAQELIKQFEEDNFVFGGSYNEGRLAGAKAIYEMLVEDYR